MRYVTATGFVAVALLGVAAWVWPPRLGATGAALALLFALAESHPFQLRLRGRAEALVVCELAVALAAIAVGPSEAAWVAVAGSLLAVPTVRYVATHERLRVAPVERHVLNVAKNVVGAAPIVVLSALVVDRGPVVVWGAAAIGLCAHALITYLLVDGAIRRARGRSPSASTWPELVEAMRVAAGQALLALPLGLVLRTTDPGWPVVLVLGLALVLIARARMGRDLASYRLSMVTTAVERIAEARTVPELDDELRRVLATALQADRVRLLDDDAPTEPWIHDHLVGRLGPDGPWVSVTGPSPSAPWTRLDQELLQALLSAVAPARRRLETLVRVREAERFASLVLTTAGHDVTNQLHTATMALDTLANRLDGLDAATRDAVVERATRAIERGARALADMVALGAGPHQGDSSAAELALATRGFGFPVHVTADNVRLAAPASVMERIVDNLLANAARHQPDGQPLDVTVLRDGGDVVVAVRDRGPGLDGDQVQTLFLPFTQLADRGRRRGSLGLGLFIARGLAESVGGQLAYRDRVGGGAVFEVRVPSAGEHVREGAQERVVLGPRADRDPEAPSEARPCREVAHEDAARQ